MARRTAAAVGLLVVACACGSPTRPSPSTPPPSTAPVVTTSTTIYDGYYRMTSCSNCASWIGQFWRFTLTLARTGDNYSARLQTSPWGLVTALTGSRQADGTLALAGSAGPANSILIGAEFRDVVIKEDPQFGLTGTFTYTTMHADGPSSTIAAVIPSATVGIEPPSSGAQSLEGTWTGTADTGASCSETQTSCDQTFGLTIFRQTGTYVALWDFSGNPRIVVKLTGADGGDAAILQGFAEPPPGVASGQSVAVEHLTIRVDAGGALKGEFQYSLQGRSSRTVTGVIVGGARRVTTASPGPFHGEWKGDYITRTCSGDCASFRVSMSGLPLTLTQAGAFVQGQYATEFTISGSASGAALVLEGGDETPSCVAKHGGPCSERLRIVVTSIDEFGQMSGTVEHTWNGKYDLSITSGELWHMVRQIL